MKCLLKSGTSLYLVDESGKTDIGILIQPHLDANPNFKAQSTADGVVYVDTGTEQLIWANEKWALAHPAPEGLAIRL